MGRRGHFCSPDCSGLFFDFITARPHSEQTSSSNQTLNDGLAVSLAFAVIHIFPRHRLCEEMNSVIVALPFPPFLIIPLPTTSVFPLISCSFVTPGLIRRTPVDSHLPPQLPNLNVNATAAP